MCRDLKKNEKTLIFQTDEGQQNLVDVFQILVAISVCFDSEEIDT